MGGKDRGTSGSFWASQQETLSQMRWKERTDTCQSCPLISIGVLWHMSAHTPQIHMSTPCVNRAEGGWGVAERKNTIQR